MKKFYYIAFLLLQCYSALAGEPDTAMTLNDCLIYARDHAHVNRISRVQVEMAESDVKLSASNLLPSLSFSSSGSLSFGRNIDPETNTYDTRKTVSNSYNLSLSLPIFDGLVSINSLKASKVARERQKHNAQAEEDQRSLDVIKAFYNVFYSKSLVEQMRGQLSRDSLLLVGVTKEFELGTKSGADVAELTAVVASDEYELTNQLNNLKKAYLTLKGDMGMPLDAPDPKLDEGYYKVDCNTNFENPRLAMARLALGESQIRVKIAKGTFSPNISLSSGVATSFYRLIGDKGPSPQFSRQLRDNMGEYIGVSLSLPLFRGLSRINSLKRARLNETECRLKLEQVKYELERETANALLDVNAAEEEYQAAIRRLEAEEVAYKAILRKFELGGASAIDLFTAGARLASARAGHEGKRIQSIISRILLSYYRGGRLIAETSIKR